MLEPRVFTRRLLVVHPDASIRSAIARIAEDSGYSVHDITEPAEIPRITAQSPGFPIAIIGIESPSVRFSVYARDPLETIAAFRHDWPETQIVLLSEARAKLSLSLCSAAISAGVAGFVELTSKEVDRPSLLSRLEQAFQRYQREQSTLARFRTGLIFDETGFVGSSPKMASLLSNSIRAAAISDAPVLIHGESGTGKQRLAELIHRLDPKRCRRRFLSVNCASINGELADSALFGHVRGAYTGAARDRLGYFRSADGGVLFLDEIGELGLPLQPKLLRVLQEGLVLPVGSDTEHPVDVRVLAATHRRLPAMIQEGRFRLDLFQRLSVITLDIPPLRERPEDIPSLIDFFVRKYSDHYQGSVTRVNPRVYEVLGRCALEGNVRELENLIRRSLAFKTAGDELDMIDLPSEVLESSDRSAQSQPLPREVIDQTCRLIERGSLNLADFVGECERSVLAGLLSHTEVSHSELARRLGVSRRTLYNKLNRFGL